MRAGALILAAAVVLAAAPDAAEANGRAPQSMKLRFRPGNANDALLGVTFGLMLTHDNAATWRWVCESAVGFEGTFDPDYEYASTGTIYATTFDGLRYTRDGCAWTAAPAPLGAWLVTAVTIAPNGTVYAGAADPVLGSRIFKSTDDGASWQMTGDMNQVFDWYESIEVAPSDPQKLYVTGYKLNGASPRLRLLFRSNDGGATWESLPVDPFVGTDISALQVMAIDPANPDVAYVKMSLTASTLEEKLYRTANWSRPTTQGGPQWAQVLVLPGFITGVVVRNSGDVWVTSQTQGIHRSTTGGTSFTQVSGLTYEAMCIAERENDRSLWMCASDLPPDLMAVGRSDTGEAGTWQAKLRYADLAGPVRCNPGTDQRDDCEARLWCGIKDQFGVTSTEITCPYPENIDGTDAVTPNDPKTCCGANGRPPGIEIGLAALGLLLRRRRRRAAC